MPTTLHPPLRRGHWLVLGLWLLAATGFSIFTALSGRSSDGWEDLITFLALVFLAFALGAIVVAWAIARFFLKDPSIRTLVLLIGPPGLIGIVGLLLRLNS